MYQVDFEMFNAAGEKINVHLPSLISPILNTLGLRKKIGIDEQTRPRMERRISLSDTYRTWKPGLSKNMFILIIIIR